MGDGLAESLTVEGLTAPQIGDLAARDGIRVHELTPVTASLEDAFMELTQDEVEYRPSTMAGTLAGGEKEYVEMTQEMTHVIQVPPDVATIASRTSSSPKWSKILTLRSTADHSRPTVWSPVSW